jgi:hypothetical protein
MIWYSGDSGSLTPGHSDGDSSNKTVRGTNL